MKYHDEDFKKIYWKVLKGEPDDILKKYKEENQEGEVNQEQQQENKENEHKKYKILMQV